MIDRGLTLSSSWTWAARHVLTLGCVAIALLALPARDAGTGVAGPLGLVAGAAVFSLLLHRQLCSARLLDDGLELRSPLSTQRVPLAEVEVVGRTGRSFVIGTQSWPVIELRVPDGRGGRRTWHFLPHSSLSESLLRQAVARATGAATAAA
jgi:hypothetical protein